MDPGDRASFIINRVFLVEHLHITDIFLDVLMIDRILLKDHAERILNQCTSSDKVATFLRILPTRGPKAMSVFMSALLASDQGPVLKKVNCDAYVCMTSFPH